MERIEQLTNLQLDRVLAQLKGEEIFRLLPERAIQQIAERCHLFTLKDSETLFEQDSTAEHIYLLSTGKIKLIRQASTGAEKILELVHPGNTFAEAVLFSEQCRYPVSACSLGDSSVWAIDGKHYMSILDKSPKACIAIIRRLAKRLFEHVAEIEKLTLHTATSRLISYLLAQAPKTTQSDAISLQLDVPKNVLSSRLSIVPSTLSRVLQKLSKEQLISVEDDNIVLLDVKKLNHYSRQLLV